MNIPMVDLKSQYLKIKAEVDKKVADVINDTAFINGEDVKEFKNELADYLKEKHVVTCGNGTEALKIDI